MLFVVRGMKIKIKIDIRSASTPPSLLGIDRRIAYANKKYHSGWMCTGVTKGLAGMKLSGSPSIYGLFIVIIIRINVIVKNPMMSLNVK